MGNILNSFKKSFVEQFVNDITANTARYYAFAANPVLDEDYLTDLDTTDKTNIFDSNYLMIFGKKLSNTDVMAMTRKIEWESNTVYDIYNDRTDASNSNFFVVVPADPGYYRHVYKCIYNNDGEPSTSPPNLIQPTSFTKSDGYIWRYLYSISDLAYSKFSTDEYIPITPNATIQSVSIDTTGIETIIIENAGTGYITYHDGTIKSVVNSTVVEIENTASLDNEFYTNNAIYIYNTNSSDADLKTITKYVSNSLGKWIYMDSSVNTSIINPNSTKYKISPAVVFNSDGDTAPLAYSVINTVSNTVNNIVIIENGVNITRADVTLVSNTIYGSGANIYCIIPPPGGHGHDPAAELGVNALGIAFSFNGSESNTISTYVGYNRIGIIKNPYSLNANLTKGSIFSNSTFEQLIKGTISPVVVFSNNEIVTGQTSNAKGIVTYLSNDSIYIIGDKHFSNNETIVSSNGDVSTVFTINTNATIYTKDLYPLYTQEISDVTRSNNQSEAVRIIINLDI